MPEKQTAKHDSGAAEEFGPASFGAPRRSLERNRAQALHICPACDSELVYPVDWSPAERKRWSVDLRCPDCEWTGGGVYSQAVVDRFDEALDNGTEQLLDDLNLLSRANMQEQVDRFVAALNSGDILPEDF
jgi:hypothetical protein